MAAEFPPRPTTSSHLTAAGTETEILQKWGFEMPEFAMLPLLDNAEADRVIAFLQEICTEYAGSAFTSGAVGRRGDARGCALSGSAGSGQNEEVAGGSAPTRCARSPEVFRGQWRPLEFS
mgnify:CR=1 FL=1